MQGDQPRSDPANLERDKGPNALDTRHSFNGSIVAMSHFNHGPTALRKLLSDNQVGVILQFNSGLPFTLTSNRDLNVDGNTADRPLNVGRNSYYLPARYNVDARLSRFIPLGGAAASRSWASSRTSSTSSRRPASGTASTSTPPATSSRRWCSAPWRRR